MAETNTTSSVKKHYDYTQQQIDEQAILDKYNAATVAQYNAQKEQNRLAENQFYNQMYNTQRTAMDTIRKANAAAVSSGASRGVQAANELSALLGLQQESVASATELAQASRQTAQEETAAMLENVLNAYQQAAQERSQLVSQGIEAASVDATDAQTLLSFYQQALANGDKAGASAAWNKLQNYFGSTGSTGSIPGAGTTPAPILESGIQEDGSLAFSTSDLNEKNRANIYTALEDAGYDFGIQRVVNLANSNDYDLIKQKDFDSKTQKGEAANYINALKADAEAGKIPVGAIVQLNYGDKASSQNYSYVYLGGSNFAKIKVNVKDMDTSKIYAPEGYSIKTTTEKLRETGPQTDELNTEQRHETDPQTHGPNITTVPAKTITIKKS